MNKDFREMISDIPTVSIIIPAHNEEKFIGKTLNSLLKQNFDYPFEIIVVNNASSDNTASIARGFGVRVIDENKKGIGFARQTGLEHAKGEIVVTTDADCRFLPNWFNNLSKPLIENKRINIVYGTTHLPANTPLKLRIYNRFYNFWRYVFQQVPIFLGGANMAFRKNRAMQVGGYNTELPRGEDVEISWRIWSFRPFTSKCIYNAKIITSPRRLEKITIRHRILSAIQDGFNYLTKSRFKRKYEDVRD